jgi:hypothetical protein
MLVVSMVLIVEITSVSCFGGSIVEMTCVSCFNGFNCRDHLC